MIFKSFIFVILSFGFFQSCKLFAQNSSSQNAINPMKILFIGNSYTHYNKMPELFGTIAKSKKIKLDVVMNAKSNHTFKMHCQRPEMFESIRSEKWDYVVLQGFSRELMYDKEIIDTASIPYFKKILDSVYANHSCTNILLYMTWGYKNGFVSETDTLTFEEMSNRVQNGYQYLSNLYNLSIVPIGQIWKTFRKNYPTIDLYQEDGQHPNLNGSYLIASGFYASIFKSSPSGGYFPKMDSSVAMKIQNTAFKYIINNVDTFSLSNNTLDFDYGRSKKGEFFVKANAFFPQADSLHWIIDNRIISRKKNFQYQFKKEGNYFIKLLVFDKCGIREIIRKAVFKAPLAPKSMKKSRPKRNAQTNRRL
jgi:hypothetical protein